MRDGGGYESNELIEEARAVDAGLARGAGEVVEVGAGGAAVVLAFAEAEPVPLVVRPEIVGCAVVETALSGWINQGESLNGVGT